MISKDSKAVKSETSTGDEMHSGLVTLEELADALEARLDLIESDARERAEAILDIFGYGTHIIDNVLEPAERQFLYALQSAGLFTTRAEVNTLMNGQDWRTHYWIMRPGEIHTASLANVERRRVRELLAADAAPYDDLPDEVWARG